MKDENFPCLKVKHYLDFFSAPFQRYQVEYSVMNHGVLHLFKMLLDSAQSHNIFFNLRLLKVFRRNIRRLVRQQNILIVVQYLSHFRLVKCRHGTVERHHGLLFTTLLYSTFVIAHALLRHNALGTRTAQKVEKLTEQNSMVWKV
jgi:hypothetical protein